MAKNITLWEAIANHQQRVSQSTAEIDDAVARWAMQLGGEDMLLTDITPRFCMALVSLFKQNGLSDSTQRTYLTHLNTILHKHLKRDAPNLTEFMPPPAPTYKEALSAKDVARLHQTPCLHTSTAQAFFFAMNTALRYSDIASLRWNHIVFANGETTIRKKMVKTGQIVHIELNSEALNILHKKAHEQHITLGATNKPSLVFHDLLSYNTIRNDLHTWAIASKISVKNLTFHISRHTFASVTYANNIPLSTISRLLGHRSLLTTENYIHSFRQDEHNAVEVVANYGKREIQNRSKRRTGHPHK